MVVGVIVTSIVGVVVGVVVVVGVILTVGVNVLVGVDVIPAVDVGVAVGVAVGVTIPDIGNDTSAVGQEPFTDLTLIVVVLSGTNVDV